MGSDITYFSKAMTSIFSMLVARLKSWFWMVTVLVFLVNENGFGNNLIHNAYSSDTNESPKIEGVTNFENNTSTGLHSVPLPSNIQQGELLVMVLRPGAGRTITIPTDWSELSSLNSGGRSYIIYKIASNNEGKTQNIQLNNNGRLVAITYRISNWEGVPSVSALSSGNSTSINPPAISINKGTEDALFLAIATHNRADRTVSSVPNGFSDLISARAGSSGSQSTRVSINSVSLFSALSDIDPSEFNFNGEVESPHSFTVAIKGKRKVLSVTSNSASKIYGEEDPDLTYSVSGFQDGDNADILTGSLSRVEGENVGSYAISQGTLAATGYSIEFFSSDFIITPKTLTITPDSDQFKLLGQEDPEILTYKATGFEFSDTNLLLSGSLSRNEGEAVGFYPIDLGTLKISSDNYLIEFIGGVQFEIRSNPSQYVVTPSLTNPKAGSTITISAQLADENGSAIPQAGRTVTWSELGNITGSFSSQTSVTDTNGIATIDFVTSSSVGVSTNITASGSGGLFGTSPEILTVDLVPTQLIFIQSPSGAMTAGQPFPNQPIVEIRDMDGNRVQTATTLVSLSISEGTGELRGTVTLNAVEGVVSFSGLNIDLIGDDKSLLAEADGLSQARSETFSITAGEASRLVIYAGDQQAAQVGEAVEIAPSVIIQDNFENPVSGISVTFAVSSGEGSITPTTDIVSDQEGIATLDSWILGSSPGENTLTVSSPNLGSKTFTAIGSIDEKIVFTSNSTFTVPTGVRSIVVESWGGGGAGGGLSGRNNRTRFGAGGGGGAYAKKNLPVTPGEILNLVIGTGGFSGIDEDGENGGASYIVEYQNLIFAEGGYGGKRFSGSSSTFGGLGGRSSESKGDFIKVGMQGTNGGENTTTQTGKGGDSGYLGIGGSKKSTAGNGNAGGVPGGGGSGGLSTNNTNRSGGSGGRGQISITYPVPINQFQAVISGHWNDTSIWEQRMSNGEWEKMNTKPDSGSQVIISGKNLQVQVNENQTFTGVIQVTSGAEMVLAESADFTLTSGSILNIGNEGILTIAQTGAIKGTGDFILNIGGTLNIANPEGIKANANAGAIQNTGTRNFNTNATIVYNGNSDQVLGDGLPQIVGTLIKDGPNKLIIDRDLQVNMNLIINSGTLELQENLFIDMSLTLNGSANMIVNQGKTLQAELLSNIITNDISKIILQPNAKYFNLGISSPRLEVRQNLTGSRGWRMMGAPIIETTYQDFLRKIESQGFIGSNRPNLQPNVLWWDETDGGTTAQGWRSPSNISQQVMPGRGHYVFVFGGSKLAGGSSESYSDTLPLTIEATGQELNLNSGGLTFDITYTQRNDQVIATSNNFTEVSTADAGFNLISNPTASFIDFQKASGWEKTNIDQTIYIWNQNKNNGNGSFELFQGNGPNNLIAPFQAFWVKANGPDPTLVMNNEAKSFQTSSFFGRILEEKPTNAPLNIKLSVFGSKMEAETILRFSSDGKDEKDEWDAYQLESLSNSWLLLYTYGSPKEKIPYAINHLALPIETEEKTIPLHLAAAWEGNPIEEGYLLKWEFPEEWPSHQKVILMDHISEKAIDMADVSEYRFKYEAPTSSNANLRKENYGMKTPQALVFSGPVETEYPNGRVNPNSSKRPFSIVIGYQGSGTKPEYRPEFPKLYIPYPNPFIDQAQIKFYLPMTTKAEIKILDSNGIAVGMFGTKEYLSGIHELVWAPSASTLSAGLYFVQLITEDQVITQKLLKK
jgi:hypothetical protein